ncbi:MAG: SPOR domain-containing protein [Bacteroidia bacterium]|nr:SPOR domain-containing protein [Bacteroidia bacterium]
MKVFNIVFLLMVLIVVGCKTQKIAPKPEPVKSETVVKPSTGTTQTITSKEEKVTAANGEAKDLGSKKFYIILGSFGVFENAQKFKKQLMAEDFFPGILINEAGLYRVSVNSYDDEASARTRVGEIRQKFPQYNDLWLLIKKQ